MGHLIVDKVTQPTEDATIFEVVAMGTGTIIGSAAGEVTDATDEQYEVTPGTYAVMEIVPEGWTEESNTCAEVAVAAGETKTCVITNVKLPKLTLVKTVVNNNSGTAVAADFQAMIDGSNVAWNAPQMLAVGTHTASEAALTGYAAGAWGGDCAADGTITLAAGENKTCTITNDDIPPQVEGKLLISEVIYDLGTGQGTEPGNEWVELYNGTNSAINLLGYYIHDALSADALPSVLLPAGKFAVISGSSTTQTFWSIPNDAIVIVLSNATIGNGLANGGDMVWLENTASTTVDAVSWGSNTTAFSPSVPAAPDGNSIVRTNLTTDTDTASDWVADSTPTPGA